MTAMISARKLNEILKVASADGIDGLCLLTVEGSVLASHFSDYARSKALNEEGSFPDETSLTAISATIWNQYNEGIYLVIYCFCFLNMCIFATAVRLDQFFHLIKLEQGYFGIAAVKKSYLIAGIGNVSPGLLRSRLHAVSESFSQMFDAAK